MIEVGDYVRIKNGPIRKIIAINEGKEKTIFGKYRLDKDYNNCRSVAEKKIVKHRKKIIDLIEVGDYVNGSKVIDIAQGKTKAVYIESQEQKFALIPIVEKQIKSIVTKEMMKSVEYIVKEEQ